MWKVEPIFRAGVISGRKVGILAIYGPILKIFNPHERTTRPIFAKPGLGGALVAAKFRKDRSNFGI